MLRWLFGGLFLLLFSVFLLQQDSKKLAEGLAYSFELHKQGTAIDLETAAVLSEVQLQLEQIRSELFGDSPGVISAVLSEPLFSKRVDPLRWYPVVEQVPLEGQLCSYRYRAMRFVPRE